MAAPLDDVVVLEIDNWMAAPSAAAVLADMGATVIKIEPLTGDPMRDMSRPVKNPELAEGLQSYDFQFDVDNRGKQSIAVALDKPEGAELVRKLVAKADIFMCNLLTARQQKFGLDPDTLFNVNPKLVHATLLATAPPGLTLGDQVMTLLLFLAALVCMTPRARVMTALYPWLDPPKVITPRAWLWWARFLARCVWPKKLARGKR